MRSHTAVMAITAIKAITAITAIDQDRHRDQADWLGQGLIFAAAEGVIARRVDFRQRDCPMDGDHDDDRHPSRLELEAVTVTGRAQVVQVRGS